MRILAVFGYLVYELGWLIQRHPIGERTVRWYDWLGLYLQKWGADLEARHTHSPLPGERL